MRPQYSKADYCLQNATGSASLPAEPRQDIDPDEIKVQPSASTKEVDPSTSFVSASPQIPPELSNETEETVKQTGPGFQVLASGYKGKINAKVNEPTGTATHHGNPSKKPRTF